MAKVIYTLRLKGQGSLTVPARIHLLRPGDIQSACGLTMRAEMVLDGRLLPEQPDGTTPSRERATCCGCLGQGQTERVNNITCTKRLITPWQPYDEEP